MIIILNFFKDYLINFENQIFLVDFEGFIVLEVVLLAGFNVLLLVVGALAVLPVLFAP